MGVSYNVFVGPYLEAPNPKKATKREFHGCPTHKEPSSAKFCHRCGDAIKLISVPSTGRVEFDCYSELNDRLSQLHEENMPGDKEDIAIFQPNKGKFGQRLGGWDAAIAELNETVMIEEVARFKTTFAADIEKIKAAFGDAKVKWGIIAYAS